jgi:hypothetical protein
MCYVSEEVRTALKQLSATSKKPIQVLLCEAINALFEEHGIATRAEDKPLPRGGAAHIARRQIGKQQQ